MGMNYYCSSKFTDLLVHVQGRLLYNCCYAYPERVNLEWLEANPGKLFHTDTMLEDRKLMLEDKSCTSCHFGCYKYEEQGLSSARLQKNTNEFITNPKAPLKDLSVSLSTDCNLTCAYCGPEWSTTWQKDLKKNGNYELTDFKIKNDNFVKLWSKIKQKSRSTDSKFFDLLLREISLAKDLESISVLGGEPLLHNQLEMFLEQIEDKNISITTGLGVSLSRLSRLLKKMKGKKIDFAVSGETTGKFFEFLRYGNRWNDFLTKVKMISDAGFEVSFISTISNISLFDFTKFYDTFHKSYNIHTNTMTERPFLMPHVIDDKSKDDFIKTSKKYENTKTFQNILKSLNVDVNEIDRINLGNYVKQFSSRRSIDISFLPEHFRKWCNLV
jgi:organic radical activating enzyme